MIDKVKVLKKINKYIPLRRVNNYTDSYNTKILSWFYPHSKKYHDNTVKWLLEVKENLDSLIEEYSKK